MTKTIKLDPPVAAVALFVGAMFLSVGIASAASVTDVTFNDDESSVKVSANETIDAELRIVVGAGEEVEFVETDFDNDNRAAKCADLNERLLEGTHYVDISLKAPKDKGTFDLDVATFGLAGVANAGDCSAGYQNGSDSFGNVVRVRSDANDEDNDTLSGLQAQIEALKTLIAKLTGGAPSGKCAVLAQKIAGSVQGVSHPGNVVLQGYLLGEGANIPALAAGASFGFFGPQTMAAVAQFKTVNSCQ